MKELIMAATLGIFAGMGSGDSLDGTRLDGLLTGNTAYIAIPGDGPEKIAPFKFGTDGTAGARLPDGLTLVGKWRIEKDRYCVDWDNGPKNSCTKIKKGDGRILMIDASNGEPRGEVLRLVPGNPEEL